jgi:hypothetical protein
MTVPPTRDDDDLGELPPLDGDLNEEPGADDGADDLPADGDASLDDATGEDEPADATDLDLADSEGGWLDEPADAPDLNLGAVALVDFADERDSLEDVDELGVGDEDFGLGAADSNKDELDGGDEGPLDEDDALREEDLPRLDADDEGNLEDAALVDAGFAGDEPAGLPWAPEPWSRVGAPVGLLSATAVACVARGAIVAGRTEEGTAELVRVDLEGTSQTLSAAGLDVGAVRALVADGDRLVALLDAGHVAVSKDGGARFAPALEGVVAADIALAGGFVWVRTSAGGVLRCSHLVFEGGAPSRVHRTSARRPIGAIAADLSGAVAGLVADDTGRVLGLVDLSPRDAELRLRAEPRLRSAPLSGERAEPRLRSAEPPDARMPATLAVRGAAAAYPARRGGVVRRLEGTAWQVHVWEGRVAGLAFLDDVGTLVAATYSDMDDTTALVRLDPSGVASIVARIDASHRDTDGCALAVAYDDPRGVVWVVGGFGVAAFAVR